VRTFRLQASWTCAQRASCLMISRQRDRVHRGFRPRPRVTYDNRLVGRMGRIATVVDVRAGPSRVAEPRRGLLAIISALGLLTRPTWSD